MAGTPAGAVEALPFFYLTQLCHIRGTRSAGQSCVVFFARKGRKDGRMSIIERMASGELQTPNIQEVCEAVTGLEDFLVNTPPTREGFERVRNVARALKGLKFGIDDVAGIPAIRRARVVNELGVVPSRFDDWISQFRAAYGLD